MDINDIILEINGAKVEEFSISIVSPEMIVVSEKSGIGCKAVGKDAILLYFPCDGGISEFVGEDINGAEEDDVLFLASHDEAAKAEELFQTVTEGMWKTADLYLKVGTDKAATVIYKGKFDTQEEFHNLMRCVYAKMLKHANFGGQSIK